jgi:hypothetical protein
MMVAFLICRSKPSQTYKGPELLQISEITTKKQFLEMKNYWDQTLDKSLENNIFLTWEKMAPSVNYLPNNSSLKILCATEGNELVGIAPFRIT